MPCCAMPELYKFPVSWGRGREGATLVGGGGRAVAERALVIFPHFIGLCSVRVRARLDVSEPRLAPVWSTKVKLHV